MRDTPKTEVGEFTSKSKIEGGSYLQIKNWSCVMRDTPKTEVGEFTSKSKMDGGTWGTPLRPKSGNLPPSQKVMMVHEGYP